MIQKTGISVKILGIMICMLCILICGCGRQEYEISSVEEKTTDNVAYVDISTQKWTEYQNVAEERTWNVVEYIEDLCSTDDLDLIKGDALYSMRENEIYCVQEYHEAANTSIIYRNLLYVVDTAKNEIYHMNLEFSGMRNHSQMSEADLTDLDEAIRKGYGRIISLDVLEEHIVVTIAIYDEELQFQKLYLVKFNQSGELLQGLDIAQAIWGSANENNAIPDMVVGPEGNTYLIDNAQKAIIILDGEGERLTEIMLESEETVFCAGKTIKNSPVFYGLSNTGVTTYFFDTNDDAKRVFSEKRDRNIQNAWVDQFGGLFFVTPNDLCYWNVVTGESQIVYSLNGLKCNDVKLVTKNAKKEIIILIDDGKENDCIILSEHATHETKTIRAVMWGNSEYISSCVAEYERKHPGVKIELEKMNEENEMALNILVENMKNGTGPDLLILRRKELEILQDANCLELLDDIIPTENRVNLFAAALDYGKIADETYGIPFEAEIETLLIANQNWEKSTWTLSEAMDLYNLKKENNDSLKYFESTIYPVTPDQLLYDLLLCHIEDSSFLDMEGKTCDFKKDEFKQFLSFCKENGETGETRYHIKTDEKLERVMEGKALTNYVSGGFLKYSGERSKLGEEYHSVGFPTGGVRVGCYKCVAVSKMAQNYDIIEDFVLSLLSEKNQINYTTNWIRKDVMQKRVKEHTDLSENPVFLQDGYNYIELYGKADGSSFLEEYIELMESGNIDLNRGVIQNIIFEEASAYFADDRDLLETVEVIQNRVQLYLSE